MAGGIVQGSTEAGPTKGLELGLCHLPIQRPRRFSAPVCSAPVRPPGATRAPTLAPPLSGSRRLRPNTLTFVQLTFFMCKVAGLIGRVQ